MAFKWNLEKRLAIFKRIYRTRKRQVVCAILAILFCVFIIYNNDSCSIRTLGYQKTNEIAGMQQEMNLEYRKRQGCDLPKLNPFSKEAMAYSHHLKNPPAVNCPGPDWVTCHKSECFVKDEILKNLKNVVCNYEDIIFVTDDYYYLAKPIKVIDGDKYFLNESDHVKVSCRAMDEKSLAVEPHRWNGYKAGFRPIVLPPRSSERKNSLNVLILAIDSASHNGFIRGMPKTYKYLKEEINAVFLNGLAVEPHRWNGYKAGFRPIVLPPRSSERKNSLNVLILAIDSASHNGFIRGMPKTYKYLKEEINAVFLNGHTIVGDATAAAMFPFMTGKAESEYLDITKLVGYKEYLDEETYIFHHVKKDGYRTVYFEDMPNIGTFQFKHSGFNKQPADHYLRVFLVEERKNRKHWFGKYRSPHCIGGDPSHQLLLNLTGEFMQLDGKKFCFTFVSELAHEDFNRISYGDNDTLHFLKMLVDMRLLEDTLLVVMGDHGCRYESVRNTHQGRIEERLPLMAITLPERLKRERPDALEALEHNKDMLTTHFDVHTTLLDILDLKKYINKYKVPGANIPRALSLLEKIPNSRTCSEAGISPHWCVCVKWFSVPRGYTYERVGNFLADYIDELSANNRDKCAYRMLTSIEWVMKQTFDDEVFTYRTESFLDKFKRRKINALREYYQAKIIMSPGDAIFEGTLEYDVKSNSFHVTASDISRIDRYGNESECISVSDPHLLKYCYCKDKLPQK